MSVEFVLNAIEREDAGKGASRRLRRLADQVPAIVYGGDAQPRNVAVEHRELIKALENEAFYSHVITLKLGGSSEDVILKDLQRHPAKPRIMHADFQRVFKDQKITVQVPLHFINEDKCPGVKTQGGIVQHNANEAEISCLPKDLPEYIEVDMIACEVGTSVHLSDLVLPEGVTSVPLSHGPEHDLPVATVIAPRGAASDEEEQEGEAAEADDAEAPSED